MERARPFVGRGDELDRLRGHLERAGRREGRLVLLVGEAGIGKTRLSDELTAHATQQGALVTWGRCWEGEGAAAYWPWIQILRGLGGSAALSALMGTEQPHAASLHASDVEQARFRLFDDITSLISRASEEQSLVIVLDDLHDADVPSLLLLRFVARALRGMRVLVVGTHRPAEARMRPSHGELLAKIAREADVFPLGRLGADAIGTWMKEGGGAASTETVAAVVRITEGNPLFVEEMLHVLRERGASGDLLARGVPDGIREAIWEHLGRLSPGTRELLDVASVIGRDFDAATIATLAGTTSAAAEQALQEAIALRVALRRDVGFSFSHVLLRDELYASLPVDRRRAVHRQLADVFRRSKTNEGSMLARAAHHAFESAGADDLDETLALARAAAARALEILAFEEAAEILERGLALMEAHGAAETRIACELLVELGRVRILSGSVAPGRAACERAADLADRIGEPVLLARAALAYGAELLTGRRDETMVRLLEKALASLPESDVALRVRVMARLGAGMIPSPDTARAYVMTREALATARTLDDPETLLHVLRFACGSFGFTLANSERIALFRETFELARSLGHHLGAITTAAWLVAFSLDARDVAASDRALDDVATILAKIPHPHYQLRLPLLRAMRATIAGRFEEAEQLGRAALAIADRAEDVEGRFYFAFNRLGLQHARGDAEGVSEFEPMMLQAFMGFPVGRAFSSLIHAMQGRIVEAIPLFEAILPIVHAAALPGCGMAAIACIATNTRQHAQRFYDYVKVHEEPSPLIWGPGCVACLGPTSLVLGRLAVMLGDEAAAAEHFRKAIAFCEEIGAHAFTAQARKDYDALSKEAAPSKRAPAAFSMTLEQRGDLWHLVNGDRTLVLKNNKGLAYLDLLIRRPGEELHCAQLVGIEERGDAGPMLDPKAKDAYRRRAEELDDTIEEATRFGDEARASKARAELEALGEELARAVGLGGRDRKAASTSERARVNVQRRIKDAIAKIAEQDAELGRYLEAFVKTGTFCSYAPP